MKDYCVTSKSHKFVYFFVSADEIIIRPGSSIFFRINGKTVCSIDPDKFYFEEI